MAIYFLFIQHIIYSLSSNGKAAIVVPTGFITAQTGIGKKIRQKLIQEKMLAGVITMPSNIFATTGTNVSVIFIDKQNKDNVLLIDASNLGETIKEGKNQKTVLTTEEDELIIKTFTSKEVVEGFSILVSYDKIESNNYSFSPGQYFEIKIEYIDITKDEFNSKIKLHKEKLDKLFHKSDETRSQINDNLNHLKYEN